MRFGSLYLLVFFLLTLGITNCDDTAAHSDCYSAEQEVNRCPKLIINNDVNDAYGFFVPENEEVFINYRLREMVEYADYVFYSTGTTHLFSHDTKVGERLSNSFIDYLDDKNLDPLKIAIEYVHQEGKQIFFSLRMNDTHDHKNENLFPEWKENNYFALVGTKGQKYIAGGRRWSAMDFEFEITREYIFELVAEAIQNYEIDGIELDFFRHPILFKGQLDGEIATIGQQELITSLVRRIALLCKDNGIKLAIRVPDSLELNRLIGIDLVHWLKSDYIDILTLGGYFHLNKWEELSELRVHGTFEMYACLSRSRLSEKETRIEFPNYFWANEAALARKYEFDGVYLFNMFRAQSYIYPIFSSTGINSLYDPEYEEQKGYLVNYWVKDGKKFYTY